MVLFVYYGYKILNFFGPKKKSGLGRRIQKQIDIFGLMNENLSTFRIRGYNSINLKNGYIQLDIRSLKEIISDE